MSKPLKKAGSWIDDEITKPVVKAHKDFFYKPYREGIQRPMGDMADSMAPDMPDMSPPPAELPSLSGTADASNRERRRQKGARGASSTILTGPLGTSSSANIGKTLLGG